MLFYARARNTTLYSRALSVLKIFSNKESVKTELREDQREPLHITPFIFRKYRDLYSHLFRVLFVSKRIIITSGYNPVNIG